MSDDDLVRHVDDELLWDPIVDPAAVAVAADNGVVKLRGTVGSFHQKRAAKRAAERVKGVTRVDNQLEVHLLTESRLEDADLRGAVLKALSLDAMLPSTIDARVEGGVVKLSGTAKHQYEREEAEFVAGNIPGVTDVLDDVDLALPVPDAGDVEDSIRQAFGRNARLDADDLTVASSNGTVTLTGVVGSWAEHDEAMAAAWAAPGVTHVDDRISVDC